MTKVGRNAPCPCGSGRKYKKCCLSAPTPSGSALVDDAVRASQEHLARHVAGERERRRRFGQVRDIISAEHQGYRFVAVGGELAYSKNWRTFPDFLLDYIKRALGSGWGKKELTKPLAARHPIMQWYDHVCEIHRNQHADERGLRTLILDGTTSAYLLLAYDLYVLRRHGKLQKEVLRRLRRPDLFTGARYELFVAATFIRAASEIEYEDETDSATKHPEFVATHKDSGLVVSVEAKARHRPPGAAAPSGPGVKHLLKAAAEKTTSHPLIAIIEVNMPPEDASRPPSWVPDVEKNVIEIVTEHGGKSPLDLAVFTNLPHQYGQPGEPDPARHFYALRPNTSGIPEYIIDAIGQAVKQYGNVPNEFPSDFNVMGETA